MLLRGNFDAEFFLLAVGGCSKELQFDRVLTIKVLMDPFFEYFLSGATVSGGRVMISIFFFRRRSYAV